MKDAAAHVPTGPEPQGKLSPKDPDFALHLPIEKIDAKDEGTPDAWVPRHPDLVRLTGRHPFNCEPTLPDLMKYGFVTPASLHYVRNHGAVPSIKWDQHRVTINGMVDKPMTLSMNDIVALPSITIPVTLVCAGNRRKEQNMVSKTIGFNWGPAGTSTGYWTGVRLADLLKLARAKGLREGARHVAFRGPKGELPQGKDGSYGTSLKIEYAVDPANDVLVAYKYNGRYLTPDHGFPVRMIIPGFIGGRMVKFLEEITVQSDESDNHYHFMDNRVLPSHVTAEKAKDEGWWFKPEYIINQLNIQSVISSPAHDEELTAPPETAYTMKGYVYTGGGRKIIRMEVSFDQGETWELATLRPVERPTEYGRYWCWVFWEMPTTVGRMAAAKEIWCRGWDEGQNTQPERLTWNLMGMMNNCVFKLKVHPGAAGAVKFEQPTQPGATPGGWMTHNAIESGPAETAVGAAPVAGQAIAQVSNGKVFTWEEIRKHDNEDSCWFVVDGRVYDSTRYNKDHPGGATSILLAAGDDATEEFMSIHSQKAKNILKEYYIGDVAGAVAAGPAAAPVPAPSTPEAGSGRLTTLQKKKRVALPLVSRREISHDTIIFRFGLPSEQHYLGLPVGQHFFIYGKVDGELVVRAYTPITADNVQGYVELLIKVYKSCDAFPAGGKMSQLLNNLALGDTIEVKGPLGHFEYLGKSNYTEGSRKGVCRNFSMVAGGTGITPMWQVLSSILEDTSDMPRVKLLFANRNEDDILLREELDALAAKHENFEVWYTLSGKVPDGWTYSTGRINETMLREHIFPAGEETLCLLCGPQGMIDHACKPNLVNMGYSEESMIEF
mmetsp:Transcript_12808/g.33016  ORF Transcript_12808/g.33016 Transcript_12808/m.33016 type:complete len:834 (+) Transcript_12808:157-2658(+)